MLPINGGIFIATTNKFEHMYKICPALFRIGRFEPINFGYFNGKVLNDVCEYYFKQKLTINNDIQLTISPADVLGLVEESKQDGGFEWFKEQILKCIK